MTVADVFAIDPGNSQSAYVRYNPTARAIVARGIIPNDSLERRLDGIVGPVCCVIEMIASYGMPVGADVFETAYWIGRFASRWDAAHTEQSALMYRREVKIYMCKDARAKDSNIRQALIDLFGPTKHKAIGLKNSPGPLYGIRADEWSALAIAVTFAARSRPF